MSDRVTRTAVHSLIDTESEPESTVRVTRTATHVMADTESEPVSPVRVTRTAVHSLIDTASEPVSPVYVTRTAVHVLMLNVNSFGPMTFTIRLRFRTTGCAPYDMRYRLRIRNDDDTDDVLVVDTDRTSAAALIAEAPKIDGSTFDPLTGKVTAGAARIMVIDADAGTCLEPDPTIRTVTQILADSGGNSQLLSRRAFLEVSRDGLATPYQPYFAGYITSMTLVDGITWEIQMAHTTRDEETSKAWATSDISTLYATSRMVGGPVSASVPSPTTGATVQFFQGYWKATVEGIYDTFVHLDINEDTSQGFPPSDIDPFLKDNAFFVFNDNNKQRNVFKWAQGLAQKYFVRSYPSTAAQTEWVSNPTGKASIRGYMPRLLVHFVDQDGSPIDEAVPMMASYEKTASGKIQDALCWEDLGNHFYVYWPDTTSAPNVSITTPNTSLAVNDVLSFYIRAVDVSEASPAWLYGHPVDLLKDLLEYGGATVLGDTTAKAGMGDFALAMRITKSYTIAEAITTLCAAFGLGVRYDDSGTRTIFCWRTRQTPVATITLDDLVTPSSAWWKTEEQSRVFSAEWKFKRFDKWPGQDQDGTPSDRAFDGVAEFDELPIVFQTANVQPAQSRTESYEIPGELFSPTGKKLISLTDVCATWTDQMFAVYANGAITTEIEVFHELLDGDMPNVGDEVTLDLTPRPGFDAAESPVSQRGFAEQCLVIGRTPTTTGYQLTLLRTPPTVAPPVDGGITYSGPGALDLSFTASIGTPDSTYVQLELDDETNWDGSIALTIEYLVQTATPSSSTSGNAWPDVWSPPGFIVIGPFPQGSTVWFRLSGAYDAIAPTAWQSYVIPSGTSQLPPGAVATPTIGLTVDNSGDVDVTAVAGPEAVKVYAAASNSAFPNEATILAGTVDTTSPYTFNNLININAGQTAFVGAIAEDGGGNKSIAAYGRITRSAFIEESISVTFVGSITAGDYRDIQVPYGCEVLSWLVLGNILGDIVVDVWRDTVANFPPTSGDSIAGSGKPTIVSGTSATGDTTGWTSTTLVKDDILRFSVDSVNTFTQVTVSLTVRRT